MGAPELSTLLWKERNLLELLAFKLEEEQLILTSGKTRWLQHATREVEQVVEHLRTAGLGRSVEIRSLAAEWGASSETGLRELVVRAPAGPWAEILQGHLQAMLELTAQIRELRDSNDRYLRAAARSTQETLAGLDGGSGTYDAQGGSGVEAGARLINQDL
ncbi:MAG TPA: flagellar protein FlgN [Micrococcaceae bacterium]|jgi:flagellar biosynthesis/type III secretory pathway chaperone